MKVIFENSTGWILKSSRKIAQCMFLLTAVLILSNLTAVSEAVIAPASYVIYKSGSTIYAQNGQTGSNDYSGADAASVIQDAIDALASGGRICIKDSMTISSSITIAASNIALEGLPGVRLTYTGNDYAIVVGLTGTAVVGVVVKDLDIYGDTNALGGLRVLRPVYKSHFERLCIHHFKNASAWGINVGDGTAYTSINLFIDIFVYDNTNGLRLQTECNHNVFHAFDVSNNTSVNIKIDKDAKDNIFIAPNIATAATGVQDAGMRSTFESPYMEALTTGFSFGENTDKAYNPRVFNPIFTSVTTKYSFSVGVQYIPLLFEKGHYYLKDSVSITESATTYQVTFPTNADMLGSDYYMVCVEPSWNTSTWISSKNSTAFTVSFGTAAPAGAKLRYEVKPLW